MYQTYNDSNCLGLLIVYGTIELGRGTELVLDVELARRSVLSAFVFVTIQTVPLKGRVRECVYLMILLKLRGFMFWSVRYGVIPGQCGFASYWFLINTLKYAHLVCAFE